MVTPQATARRGWRRLTLALLALAAAGMYAATVVHLARLVGG